MKNNLINFINHLFNKNGNLNKKLEKNSSAKLDTYINKEVIVVTSLSLIQTDLSIFLSSIL